MTTVEIILLVVGVIVFIASFIFSAKMDESDAEKKAELTERQKEAIERQIRDVFDEQVSEVKERTEIALDRLSNVKMNEMNEYSDTILSEINRNHNEVMFLYDMLNEKKKEVNNTVRDVMAIKKELNETAKNIPADKEDIPDVGFMAGEQLVEQEKSAKKRPAKPKKAKEETVTEGADNTGTEEKPVRRKRKTTTKAAEQAQKLVKEVSEKADAETQTQTAANNNDRILELNEKGLTVVEIARELGLGIGEVKLVIDLFRGGK